VLTSIPELAGLSGRMKANIASDRRFGAVRTPDGR